MDSKLASLGGQLNFLYANTGHMGIKARGVRDVGTPAALWFSSIIEKWWDMGQLLHFSAPRVESWSGKIQAFRTTVMFFMPVTSWNTWSSAWGWMGS